MASKSPPPGANGQGARPIAAETAAAPEVYASPFDPAPTDFAALLRGYRTRAGLPRDVVAREAGMNGSYLSRMEQGERGCPSRPMALTIAAALGLSFRERDGLLIAAGHVPVAVTALGLWDDALADVAEVLGDVRLSEPARAEFRAVIRAIARRWTGGGGS